MDMSASRTDVASSVEVSDLSLSKPHVFDVMAATELIDNCTTGAERVRGFVRSSMRLSSHPEDVDAEAQITPERLRLNNLRLLTRFAAEAATSETPARIAAERRSVEEAGEIGAKVLAHPPPLAIEDSSSMEEGGIVSRRESSVEIASAKSATPQIAQSSPAAKAAESAGAPDLRNLCSNSSLQGRFENGSSEFPQLLLEEHRIIQKSFGRAAQQIHLAPHSAIDVRNSSSPRFCTQSTEVSFWNVQEAIPFTSECTKSAKAPAKCAKLQRTAPCKLLGLPQTQSTKTTKSKAAKTSGKSVRLRASKLQTTRNLPLREGCQRFIKQFTGCQRSDDKNGPDDVSVGEMLSLLQSKL
ncbi:hypothetical protein TNCV_890951 [Trichonephila clavipes]|nr:hypothetical protein TNCV_890951 [Trichonephila clavipes]